MPIKNPIYINITEYYNYYRNNNNPRYNGNDIHTQRLYCGGRLCGEFKQRAQIKNIHNLVYEYTDDMNIKVINTKNNKFLTIILIWTERDFEQININHSAIPRFTYDEEIFNNEIIPKIKEILEIRDEMIKNASIC